MSQRTLVSAMYQETNRYTALAKNISDISQPVKSGKRITGEVLRNKIHAIEDACWNESDFWMPRDVTQIRVGIMGASGLSRQKIMDSICNGNSLKADQGRRYKKIVSIEDHPFLIIFREEVAEPTEEFIRWVDVFILITDSAGSIVIAKKYMNMFSKTSSLESAVGVLAAVKTPAKSKRRTFKTEDFFKIDSSNLFKHVEVNLEDETSLNSLLTTACASHIERRRKKPVPTPVSSTPACTEETHTPNFFASPIAVARPTKSRPKVSKLINPTPNPVAVSSSVNAVIETPVTANLMDGFKTPGQSTASSVYLPSTTTHQRKFLKFLYIFWISYLCFW
ncbi:unnamed protein product [Orchesella dallaii]|uniref:Uncharacterized protein n=1 Tax=Orchesella dallaii TaxID=48710 RepID=A0ABP1QKZ0_9HEXA